VGGRNPSRTKQLFSRMLVVENSGDIKRIKRLAPYLKKYKANPPA